MSRWRGATVLITGGTGWLGRHFVPYALDELDVRAVRVFSRDEHKQHDLRARGGQWSDTAPGSRISYLVGCVRDLDRLRRACRGVDIVVHAAALKRVEGSATHAREILKTNTMGTANVVDAALDAGVRWTLLISSDKAALATNCYGKSKALAEDLLVEGNALAGGGAGAPRFACVRYGNVLGSTGSVLHLWRAAVAAGRPIPLTSLEMTRFWITVGDAVRFVAGAVETMRGGELFVPAMPRGRLVDLASALYPGHEIAVCGERPGGEKLHETLIGADESRHTHRLGHGFLGDPVREISLDGYVVHPQQPTWDQAYRPYGVLPAIGAMVPCPLTSDTPPLLDGAALRALVQRAGFAVRS